MVLAPLPPRSLSESFSIRWDSKVLGRCAAVFLACWLVTSGSGCVDTELFLRRDAAPPPVCQVVATWCADLAETSDPTNHGKPVRGIAGRVYLFGAEVSNPLVGNGAVIVDLFDVTSGPKSDLPLEEWRFDPDTLKRLQHRDTIGAGYSMFLPWGTYKPEIKRVQLRVRYEPVKGTPLYTESGNITIKNPTEVN